MKDKCRKLRDKIINSYVNELRQSNFFQVDFKICINRCLRKLGERKLSQILCYGLGSFNDGFEVASRYQLALLILLHEYLLDHDSPISPVIEIYDPSFEQLDKDVLESFTQPSFSLILDNEYCARRVDLSESNRCVLVYMPHLDKFFYNNLLGSNWTSRNLSQLVILGNSFSEMIDNEIPSKCKTELHFLNLLVNNFKAKEKNASKNKGKSQIDRQQENLKALVEISLDDSNFQHQDIFNNLAFHLINEVWLDKESAKIQQNNLANWTYVTSCSADD